MRINIETVGQGKDLVFLHGWGFDSSIWQSIIPTLKEMFTIHLVDMPGFGLTDIMSFEKFNELLLASIPDKFSLLGWSLGGLVTTKIAISVPQRVDKLINVASSPCFIAQKNWPGVEKEVLLKFYNRLKENSEQVLKEFVGLQLPRRMKLEFSQRTSIPGLEQGLDWLLHWDLRDELHNLMCPIHYLFGRLDAITSVSTMEAIKTTYPQINTILFAKAAHAIFLSHPKEFVKVIQEIIL